MPGVLVAISVPIFTSQLEKSREATDQANIRSAISTLQAAYLTGESSLTDDENIDYEVNDGSYTAKVDAEQTDGDTWASENKATYANIGGKTVAAAEGDDAWTVTISKDGVLSIS